MKPAEVTELLAHIKVIWPNTAWDVPAQVVAKVWLDLLSDMPADATRATLLDLSGERFAPSPGALRLAVLDRIAPDTTPGLDEAWTEVRRGIARWGWPNPPCAHQWSHPAVADAVEAFGWRELCESENPDAARAHFARYFASATPRHRPRRAPAAVLGALDAARAQQVGLLADALSLPEEAS
jgi:hypothetical protein